MEKVQTDYRFIEVDENGKPCHFHQYKGVNMTGGSSVVDVLGKTLTYWASGLAVKEFSGIEDCKVLTKIKNGKASETEVRLVENEVSKWLEDHKGISVEEYIKICQKAYSAHAVRLDDTAQAGTDMHKSLENYVKDCIENHEGKPFLKENDLFNKVQIAYFSKWSVDNVKKFIWSEAHCFDEDLFVGGITDVGAEMLDDTLAIIDFKSSKTVYFSQFIQTAIYNLLIDKNGLVDKNGYKVLSLDKPISKYIIVSFGASEFMPVVNTNVLDLRLAAKSCIELYRQKNKFEEK